MSATPGLLSLASAAGMDLGQAADIVSDTMSAFQMEASGAGTAADIFAAASSNSNTDVLQLGEAMKYASSTANSAGMDLAQTATVLGILADSGIKGSTAGTTFNAMLRDMKKNAVDGTIAIGDHVIALYNEDGTMRSLGDIMADVNTATDGMTTKQRDAALSAIFQEESIRGVNIMLAAGTERYDELEGAITNSDGAAARMAETMEGGVGGAMREMKSATEEMMITLGNILVVAVLPLIESLTDLFNWFSELPEPIQKGVVAFLAVIAVIGPLLIAIGAVVSAVGTIAAAFGTGGALAGAVTWVSATLMPALATALGVIISPLGLIAIAVAALALAWKYNWFDIQGKAQVVWDWLKSQGNALWQQLEYTYHAIIMSCATLKTQFQAAWDALKNAFSTISGMIVSTATGLYNGLVSIFNAIVSAINTLLNSWRTQWNTFNSATSSASATLQSLMTSLYTRLKSIFDSIVSAVVSLLNSWRTQWNNIYSLIVTAATNIINKVKDIPTAIKSALGVNLYSTGSGFITNLKNGVVDALTSLYNSVVSQINKIKSAITSAKSTITSSLSSLSSSSASSLGKSLSSAITTAGTKAKVSLAEAASGLKRLLPNSPAKEGPFKELPDWDFIFLDPLMESINSVRKLSSPLSSALSGLRNPINSTSASGLRSVSNIANSNTYGGHSQSRWSNYLK